MHKQSSKTKNMKPAMFQRLKSHNYPDFHVQGISDEHLISEQNGTLDNLEEFNCDMYNFAEMENLPESDRQMIPKNQRCRDYDRTWK